MSPPTPEKRPLFVRLPTDEAARLDDAARRLRTSKGVIVAEAIARYLTQMDHPLTPELLDAASRLVSSADSPTGIDALKGAPVGRHSFTPAEELEVLTLEQLATVLDVDAETVRALAESGELPGRKLGDEWRFSRVAVMDWLAGR